MRKGGRDTILGLGSVYKGQRRINKINRPSQMLAYGERMAGENELGSSFSTSLGNLDVNWSYGVHKHILKNNYVFVDGLQNISRSLKP